MLRPDTTLGFEQCQLLDDLLEQVNAAARNAHKLANMQTFQPLNDDQEAVEATAEGIAALTKQIGKICDKACALLGGSFNGWAQD